MPTCSHRRTWRSMCAPPPAVATHLQVGRDLCCRGGESQVVVECVYTPCMHVHRVVEHLCSVCVCAGLVRVWWAGSCSCKAGESVG